LTAFVFLTFADAFLVGDLEAFGLAGAFLEASVTGTAGASFAGDFGGDASFLAGAAFLAPPEAFLGEAGGFFSPAFALDGSLNDPEAPCPLVCTSSPDSTAFFKYFLMKGANVCMSTW